MKKTVFLASLVSLLLLSGCHGTKTAVSSRFKETIPIRVEVVENRVRLSHDHPTDLHHVKMEILINDGIVTWQVRGKLIETTELWENHKFISSGVRYNAGVSWVEVRGWCDEGKLRGDWTWQVSRD